MSDGGFLARWSRRKLAPGEAEEPVPSLAETGAPESAPVTEAPVEETLDEAELAQLPSLDSLTLKTDLAPFLRKGVPHALRNAAMRKMWMLDPAIRDHKDLAVDYAWDWNTPGGVPGNSGTISGGAVARMLESLNPKPKEAATAEPASPDEPSVTEERVLNAPDKTEISASTAPEPPLEHGTDQAAGSDDSDTAAATPDDRISKPRRHGGAAPV